MSTRGVIRLAVASGVARLVVAVLWGPSFSNDAGRYTRVDGGGVAIDWLGRNANPAPLIQLLWHLPHDLAIAIQSVVAGFAWGLLAIVITRGRNGRTGQLAAVAAILASWTPMMITYDAMPLPDSVAYSGAILLLASVIDRVSSDIPLLTAATSSTAMVIGLALAVGSQPVNLVPLAPLAVVAILVTDRVPSRRSVISLALILAVVTFGLVAALNATSGQPEENRTQNRLTLRASTTYLDIATDLGMPTCEHPSREEMIDGARASYSSFGFGPLRQQIILPRDQPARDSALRALKAADCPALHEWTRSGAFDMWTPVLRAPGLHLRLFLLDQTAMFAPFSPDERVPTVIRLIDPVVWLAVTFTVVIWLSSRWIRAVANSKNRRGWKRAEAALGATAASSWFVYQVLNWMAEPLDLPRHLLPVTTMLPFLVFTLTRDRMPLSTRHARLHFATSTGNI